MHHWPVWGADRAVDLLSKGRDAYGFINDETLRLANHGFGPVEIAEMVKLPDVLDRHWALRGYYGTVRGWNLAQSVPDGCSGAAPRHTERETSVERLR
jgi:alkyl sulfatase BDS1-like metallo-beta-lactamase superfamily hydrolase